MTKRQPLNGFQRLKLQKQLAAGFLAMSFLVAVTGAAGLYFANDIRASVEPLTDLSIPISTHSFDLVEGTGREHAHLLIALESSDHAQLSAAEEELATYRAASSRSIDELRSLTARTQMAGAIETVAELEARFIAEAAEALKARADQLRSQAASIAKFSEFEDLRRQLDATVDTFVQKSESNMSAREDQGKTMVQAGDATVDDLGGLLEVTFNQSFPVLKGGYAAQGYLVAMQDLARTVISIKEAAQLPDLETAFEKLAKKAQSRLKRVRSRADDEQKQLINASMGGVENLKALVMGEDGVIAMHRAALSADADASSFKLRLAETAKSFETTLHDVVVAARELSSSLGKTTIAVAEDALIAICTVVAIGILAGLACALLISISITRPLTRVTSAMRSLAGGNTEIDVQQVDAKNEIGDLIRTLAVFRENAIEKQQADGRQNEIEREAKEQRASLLASLADELDSKISAIVRDLGESVQGMTDRIGTLRGVTDTARSMSQDVAATTEQTTGNMQSVAAASDEMSSTAAEISRQVTLSTEVVGEAGDTAAAAAEQVTRLSDSSDKIGQVVGLITEIAEQTNLLALNATIEAARAGDAGKGFAVVASEVKNLATQTAKATGEISGQISNNQAMIRETVQAISRINESIARVRETSTSIAGAVKEQNAALGEIAGSVQQVAGASDEVGRKLREVADGARRGAEATEEVSALGGELDRLSSSLRATVDNVVGEIRGMARAV